MEEIKVGEYVRTKNGDIGKVVDIEFAVQDTRHFGESFEDTIYSIDNLEIMENNRYKQTAITKHSPNIIDLIEVGDYVNGERMDIVDRDENGKVCYMQNIELPSVNFKDIKSIVTKEEFQSVMYEV